MSGDAGNGEGTDRPLDPEDVDTGEPIHELSEFPGAPSSSFLQRVRTGIDRRVLTGQLFEQAWTAPIRVVLEYIGAVIGLLSGEDDRSTHPDSKESER